jgi:hypothetical protein
MTIRVAPFWMQCGDIPRHSPTHARYTGKMPPRYIRASEVGSFASCRRAWFLERQNQSTDLSEASEAGAHSAGRPRKPLSTARLSLFLLILGIGGIACVALLATMRP